MNEQPASSPPPQWSNDYFRDPADASPWNKGLVSHVPIVAALLIVQGTLEIALGLLSAGFAAFVFLSPHPQLAGLRGPGTLMVIISVPCLSIGTLRVIAGVFNWRYRRRRLGLIALAAGLAMLLTAYCAPTAIALAIYGLIVYLNEPVITAFAIREGQPTTPPRA
jgi:hypothetical protein